MPSSTAPLTTADQDALSIGTDGLRPVVTRGGTPVTLRTATEHYGALINRPFAYRPYLEMLVESGCTLTRTFVLFRELQSATNPYSTCKPESLDYIAPYSRASAAYDEPRALDGQPKFDLDRWNPEFFDRLHDFCTRAAELGIIVELTILSNTYATPIWHLNPLHPDNHLSTVAGDADPITWPEYLSERHPALVSRQEELVGKIVTECADHPNVIFELCNEPGGDAPAVADAIAPVSVAEVNRWLRRLTAVIRETDAGRHLIAGQPAFRYEPWEQSLDLALPGELVAPADLVDVDIVNVHPLPGTVLGGVTYELGRFMNGDLAADDLVGFCRVAASCGKPVNLDEDNAATQYTNAFGWSTHRRRAWVTALHGCHYDMIDFTIRPGVPLDPRSPLRTWTRALGRTCDRWQLSLASVADGWTVDDPHGRSRAVIVRPGSEPESTWLGYVFDRTETTSWADPLPPITARLALTEPTTTEGSYRISYLDPATGTDLGSTEITARDVADGVVLPQFTEDLLFVLTRQ